MKLLIKRSNVDRQANHPTSSPEKTKHFPRKAREQHHLTRVPTGDRHKQNHQRGPHRKTIWGGQVNTTLLTTERLGLTNPPPSTGLASRGENGEVERYPPYRTTTGTKIRGSGTQKTGEGSILPGPHTQLAHNLGRQVVLGGLTTDVFELQPTSPSNQPIHRDGNK